MGSSSSGSSRRRRQWRVSRSAYPLFFPSTRLFCRALERGEIDATAAGFQDDREPEEGIVLLLDVSQSMNSTGFVEGGEGEGEEDSEEEEEESGSEDDMDWESEDEDGGTSHMPAFPGDDMEGVPKELLCPISQCLVRHASSVGTIPMRVGFISLFPALFLFLPSARCWIPWLPAMA